jgi:hypothetical protein
LAYLGYVAPFSPYMQTGSYQDIWERERTAVTDRFIPSRKLLKRDSLYQDEDNDSEQENENGKVDNSSSTVSDLYRRFIMADKPQGASDQHI